MASSRQSGPTTIPFPALSVTGQKPCHGDEPTSTAPSSLAFQRIVDGAKALTAAEGVDQICDGTKSDPAQGPVMEANVRGRNSAVPTHSKGKGRLAKAETGAQSFRLLDLPAEIRLEIYRLCLTHPNKIMLSKVERRPQAQADHFQQHGPADVDPPPSDGQAASGEPDRLAMRRRSFRPSRLVESIDAIPLGRDRLQPAGARMICEACSTQSAASVSVPSNATPVPSSSTTAGATTGRPIVAKSTASRTTRRVANGSGLGHAPRPCFRGNSLNVNILRTCKQIYKEARDVLYSENVFDIDLYNAVTSLAALHQRSRRHIRHVELEIPTYTEILESFSEVVRLSLRYCTGLKKLVIHTPFTLPGAEVGPSTGTVYANGFDILRWLPQQCQVILAGNPNPEIEAVVGKHMNLAKVQDQVAYARRQLIANEAGLALEACPTDASC